MFRGYLTNFLPSGTFVINEELAEIKVESNVIPLSSIGSVQFERFSLIV